MRSASFFRSSSPLSNSRLREKGTNGDSAPAAVTKRVTISVHYPLYPVLNSKLVILNRMEFHSRYRPLRFRVVCCLFQRFRQNMVKTTCVNCKQEFETKKSYLYHFRSRKDCGRSAPPFQCKVCFRGFINRSTWLYHSQNCEQGI